MKNLRTLSHYMIIFTLATTIADAQGLTADTSYLKPRGRLLFAGTNPKPLIRLFDPLFDVDAASNPRFGTFLPLLSLSADRSKAVIIIHHAPDAHAYAVVDIAGGNWEILSGEAAAVYWSGDNTKAAIYERYLSELQKIRIVDFSSPSLSSYTVPDVITPSAQEGKHRVVFKDIRWRNNSAINYTIVTTDSAGAMSKADRGFAIPEKKKKK
ncbi:MAG: hypothetical protein NTV54_09890 [Ignavibacteriales bacterium]|nr:hypothetical protein [Ignavibacteriales bacterium]